MKNEISVTDAEFNGLSSEVYSNGIPHPELGLGLLSLLNCLFALKQYSKIFPIMPQLCSLVHYYTPLCCNNSVRCCCLSL